ncbi:hypothetical protein GUITHDRAFT_149952, partial [Guillardia theta CCMP2712]
MFALAQKYNALKGHQLQVLDGNGEPELDSYLAMPNNTSDGDLWNPLTRRLAAPSPTTPPQH